MATDPRRIKDLFVAALEQPDSAARQAFLDRECAGDAELRQRLDSLLHAHEDPASALERPLVEISPAMPEATATCDESASAAGAIIGPYKLLEQIGEGGMGTVWMAQQTAPVKRLVAVKLIKAGMDSKQVIARFEAERQALAIMDHPNIAKVFDGGMTGQADKGTRRQEDKETRGQGGDSFALPMSPCPPASLSDAGRPYFVMELVKGVPITKYCDEHRLAPRQRLELFIPVCQAVQHAHQKGIIHRDLKPSNVLVALYDGKPVPKVIDFGVAKAAGQSLTDKTLVTGFGAIVGTLEYMSPEQAEVNQLDIDTRSDIYSLGVLLYELLTGSTPFSKKDLEKAGMLEMLRVIREDEPSKPSTKLSSSEALPTLSANRGTEPAKLTKLVRGELDWIVMKALEKDRNRRYETANGFAADVQRYLVDEAVQACPPSAGYRLRKFTRRNKASFVTASAAVLVVILAMVGLAVSNVLIGRERDEKVAALGQAKTNEKEANTQRGLAEKNEAAAKEQSGIAEAETLRAKRQELLARRRFYAAQINLAHQAWEAGNPARVLELLEGLRPRLDQEDLRSFEWYYLWRLCHAGCRFTLRAPSQVLSVAYSPDGQTLASAGGDSNIRLWDASTGQERAVLRGHSRLVWAVAFSPDRKILASISSDQTVKLWDVTTAKEVRTLGPAQGECGWLAFTADGKTLAATGPSRITLWDAASGKELATLLGHPHELFSRVTFSPDAKVLAANTTSERVRLWRWDGGQWREGAILGGHRWGTPIAFSPDSKTLAAGSGVSAKLYDVATGKEHAVLPGHTNQTSTLGSIAFSPDGKTLAVGSGDRMVRLWDVATSREVGRKAQFAPISSIAFSPNGKSLVAGSVDGTIKVWNLDPVEDAATLQHTAAVHAVAIAPDGRTLLSGGDFPTQLWDLTTGRGLPFKGYVGHISGAWPQEGRFAADRKTVASWDRGKAVKLWDLATGNERGTIPMQNRVDAMAFSPNGLKLATCGRGGPELSVHLWDVTTGQSCGKLTMPRAAGSVSIRCVAFSPDGKTLAAGLESYRVQVWDLATGDLKLSILQDHQGFLWIHSVSFSPDGKTLAAGTDTGTVRLWDAATGQLRATLKGHTDTVRSMSFSPDSKTLATGSDDATVKLWDVPTGQERMTLRGHKAKLRSVAFAPDGNVLATGSDDGTVKLWRAATEPEATASKKLGDVDDPDDPLALSAAAGRLWATGHLEAAQKAYGRVIELCTQTIEAHPEAAWAYECRVDAHVKLSQWEKAARDFEKLAELSPGEALRRYRLALVCLHLGDHDRYRKQCARMVEQFGRSASADAAFWTAWTCVLAPDAVADWQPILQLAQKAAAAAPNSFDKLTLLGRALYCAGRFEEAAKQLAEAEAAFKETTVPKSSIIYTRLFQAMTQQRLGRADQANEWFEKAIKDIEQPPQDRSQDGAAMAWNRRLTLQILRREAEKLLKK